MIERKTTTPDIFCDCEAKIKQGYNNIEWKWSDLQECNCGRHNVDLIMNN